MNWAYIMSPDLIMVAGVLFGLFGIPWILARFNT